MQTLEAAYYQLFGSEQRPANADPERVKVVVSTLGEARFYVRHGFSDVLYGVPIVAAKLPQCAQLAAQAPLFAVLVDSHSALDALEAHACTARPWHVFVDVDPGYHRSGVQPRSPEAMAIVQRVLSSPKMRFRGIYTHAGHAYLRSVRMCLQL